MRDERQFPKSPGGISVGDACLRAHEQKKLALYLTGGNGSPQPSGPCRGGAPPTRGVGGVASGNKPFNPKTQGTLSRKEPKKANDIPNERMVESSRRGSLG